MAKRLKDIKEIKIQRPPRAKLSAEECRLRRGDRDAQQGRQGGLAALDREFTYTFGGCTIARGLEGSYLSQAGSMLQDRIALIYTDTPYAFKENFEIISAYADNLKEAVTRALEEEAILIAVLAVYHAT